MLVKEYIDIYERDLVNILPKLVKAILPTGYECFILIDIKIKFDTVELIVGHNPNKRNAEYLYERIKNYPNKKIIIKVINHLLEGTYEITHKYNFDHAFVFVGKKIC